MNKNLGVISQGVKCPVIKEGDDIRNIVVQAVVHSGIALQDRDVVGITESVVARAMGNYITVDEIAADIIKKFGENATIYLVNPIYSRNRFSLILRGIARAAHRLDIEMPPFDEVGNPSGVNPFTGVDMMKYYEEICKEENCLCNINYENVKTHNILYCGLHDYATWVDVHKEYNKFFLETKIYSLADICSEKCEYGVLGSNKATDSTLKLFPRQAESQRLVEDVQDDIFNITGAMVEVMIYGDGGFKDPVGGIWEFADPVVSPAYTRRLEGSPNEIKLKYLADNDFEDLSGEELTNAIKEKIAGKSNNLVGKMISEGTTPRRYVDLLGSLMDLTSGSGDKGTPIVVVQNYFNNFAS